MHAVLEHILAAKRPVILAGDGVVRARAETALQTFAETLGIPVATTMGGKTSFPGDHPLNLGVIGRYSAKVANDLVGESDCVLVVGSRLGGLATNGYTVPNRKATILQIDTDPAVFDVTYAATVRLVADARLALEALCRETKGRTLGAEAVVWATAARQKIQAWRDGVKAATDRAADGPSLSPFEVIAVLARLQPGDYNRRRHRLYGSVDRRSLSHRPAGLLFPGHRLAWLGAAGIPRRPACPPGEGSLRYG